jgi:uncharacterized protein (DUF1015 family)
MPSIRPFRGILYNRERVDLAAVVAPPYDVISPEQQAELTRRSPYNIVRLILGCEENWYQSAAKSFNEWRRSGILTSDANPSLYMMSQAFALANGTFAVRRGFIAACALEEIGSGSIMPHERTLAKPKEDRFKLMQATGAMFSQVFSLYSDPSRSLDGVFQQTMSAAPLMDVSFENVHNRLWRVSDSAATVVCDYLRGQRVLIADGHHRYETALLYRDSLRAQTPDWTGDEPFNFVPMFFASMDDPGTVILPTHRLVHSVSTFAPAEFLSNLRRHFHVENIGSLDSLLHAMSDNDTPSFGLALHGDSSLYLLRFADAATQLDATVPNVLGKLDVSILHTVVFKNILGISEEDQLHKTNLDYEREPARAIESVRAGRSQAAFLMNPTRIEQVRAVAEAGLVMPQKSTFFYPKLLSGLVTYSFQER